MAQKNSRLRILIAAVAVLGMLFLIRAWSQWPMKLVHQVRLGQTRDEVTAIMGTPPITYSHTFCYGWSLTRVIENVIPPRGLIAIDYRYPVMICFGKDGTVNRVFCPTEGVDLRLLQPARNVR